VRRLAAVLLYAGVVGIVFGLLLIHGWRVGVGGFRSDVEVRLGDLASFTGLVDRR
jgi:hypothetical protein